MCTASWPHILRNGQHIVQRANPVVSCLKSRDTGHYYGMPRGKSRPQRPGEHDNTSGASGGYFGFRYLAPRFRNLKAYSGT
jgi:hypothetical protein